MLTQVSTGLFFPAAYRDVDWIRASWFGNDRGTLVLHGISSYSPHRKDGLTITSLDARALGTRRDRRAGLINTAHQRFPEHVL
jgi:hypothetical protein